MNRLRRPGQSVVLCVVLLSLSGQWGRSQTVAIDTLAMRNEAIARFRSGRYSGALTLYRQLANIQPSDLNAKKDLLWALWNTGHFEEASHVATQILEKAPDDKEAQNLLARLPVTAHRDQIKKTHEEAVARYQAGDYKKAIALYRELVDANPNNPLLMRDLMWALWNQQRYEEASALAERILSLRPGDPDAIDALERLPDALKVQQIIMKRRKISVILQRARMGNSSDPYNGAIPLLRELVTLDPSNPGNYNQLLSALRKAGLADEGVLVAQQMTALHKLDPASWNWLGTFQLDLGQTEEALVSYQHALALQPDQPRTLLAMGRMYLTMREFPSAVTALKAVLKADPQLTEAYPLLGKALFWTGDYKESAAIWEIAVRDYSYQMEYQFYRAQAYFYSGQQERGRAQMQKLADEQHLMRAFDFLLNDAIVQDDVAKAERMLEGLLTDVQPKDESRLLRLAGLYEANGQKDKLIATLDRLLRLEPNHQPALLIKAAALFDKEEFEAARSLYQKVHDLNPYDTEGLRGLAECEQSLGHAMATLKYGRQLLDLDPTNPRFILLLSQYYAWAGQLPQAKAMLLQWVRENQHSPVVPILLYHGLTPFADDPLLSAPYHYSIAAFENHMRALSEAGYTTVTAAEVSAWIHKKRKLPPKPILITFDDGRLDSFQYADPILLKYHFKATMCAALVNMEGIRPSGFVPWQRLAGYQKTGRWEIVSHGDISHIFIPIDSKGSQALFLSSKKWLQEEGRLETDAEWEERLRSDYQSSRDKIMKFIGPVPEAYAFPEGIFGQQGHCNTPKAEPVNRKLVQKYFSIAFSQDRAGMNFASRDPWLLTRREPNPQWTGMDLITFLHDQNPQSQMYEELLQLASWEGRTREAYGWLHKMKENEVSEPILLAQESQIRFSAGDSAQGQALAQRALMMENRPEIQKSITSSLARTGPSWAPLIEYAEDNQNRYHWLFEQVFSTPQWKKLRFHLKQTHGEYFETNIPTVIDNGVGASADLQLGLFNVLSVGGMQHYFSSLAENTYSANARLESRVTDSLITTVSGGRSPYYTARALNNNIHDHYIYGQADWIPQNPWRAAVRGRYIDLSDENRRRTGEFELSRSLFSGEWLRAVYQFTYDEMRFMSPNYYSPNRVRAHGFGPEITWKTGRQSRLKILYLPAYTMEHGAPSGFHHNAQADYLLHIGEKNLLRPSVSYGHTPTYWETIYSLFFEHYF